MASVSVARDAMTPMTTEQRQGDDPAHHGIAKRYAISATTTGPSTRKPGGPGRRDLDVGERILLLVVFLRRPPESALKDFATLRHWKAKDSRPKDTSTEAPVHSAEPLMAFFTSPQDDAAATISGRGSRR